MLADRPTTNTRKKLWQRLRQKTSKEGAEAPFFFRAFFDGSSLFFVYVFYTPPPIEIRENPVFQMINLFSHMYMSWEGRFVTSKKNFFMLKLRIVPPIYMS